MVNKGGTIMEIQVSIVMVQYIAVNIKNQEGKTPVQRLSRTQASGMVNG